MKLVGAVKKIISVSESFWSNLKFFKNDRLDCVVVKWNLRVNGMRSVFSFSAVIVLLSINLLGKVVARLNDRNRVAMLPLVFPKNQSRHNINDEV